MRPLRPLQHTRPEYSKRRPLQKPGVAFVLIAATTDACYVMAAAFIGLWMFSAASGSRPGK